MSFPARPFFSFLLLFLIYTHTDKVDWLMKRERAREWERESESNADIDRVLLRLTSDGVFSSIMHGRSFLFVPRMNQDPVSFTDNWMRYPIQLEHREKMGLFNLALSRTPLFDKSGVLHIYYANKTFKHWKKRWLHLQDQQLAIYQGKTLRLVLVEWQKC